MTLRFAFPRLLLLVLLPQVHSQGFCIGSSAMCSSQKDCGNCEFFNCAWYLFNDNQGDFCSGGSSCQYQRSCKTCEQFGSCKWVATLESPRPPTSPGNGRCSGDSIHCDGETDCAGCEFWSSCKWEIYPGEQGDTCYGSSMKCHRQDDCKSCKKANDWDSTAQCSWQPSCRGSSPFCASAYNDASCECHPECTWGHHFSSESKNYTQQCVGSGWCADRRDCGSCRAGWGCKWARVPKPHGPRSFCDARPSGFSCQGDWLTECQSSVEKKSIQCGVGLCTGTNGQASCFCDGKSPGQYCNGDDILSCPSGRNDGTCPDGLCVSEESGKTCGTPDFCQYRANGTFCDGSYLKECQAGVDSGLAYCGSGSCNTMSSSKAECGTPNFCLNRTTAAYCDSNLLKACVENSSIPRMQKHCEHGCKIQDYQAVCGAKADEAPLISFASVWGCGVIIMLLVLHATIS